MRIYKQKEVECPCKPGCLVTKSIETKICDVCSGLGLPGISFEHYAGTFFDICQICANTRWHETPKEIQRKYKLMEISKEIIKEIFNKNPFVEKIKNGKKLSICFYCNHIESDKFTNRFMGNFFYDSEEKHKPDCFDKHILGLLESLGVEIKWEEYDY